MEQEIWCKNGNSTITWKSDIHGELVVPILVPLLVGHLNVVLKLLLLFPQVWCHPWNRKTLFPSLIIFLTFWDSVKLWIQFVHLEKSEVGDSEVILNTSKTHQSCIFTSATTGYISTTITLLHYIPGKSLQRLSSILSSLLRHLEPYISVMRPKMFPNSMLKPGMLGRFVGGVLDNGEFLIFTWNWKEILEPVALSCGYFRNWHWPKMPSRKRFLCLQASSQRLFPQGWRSSLCTITFVSHLMK